MIALSSNKFTLRTGTYLFRISVPGSGVGAHSARLYNVTAGVTSLNGSSEAAGSSTTTRSIVLGALTISTASDFEVRHYTTNAVSTNGLGLPSGSGASEIYTIVEIWGVD